MCAPSLGPMNADVASLDAAPQAIGLGVIGSR